MKGKPAGKGSMEARTEEDRESGKSERVLDIYTRLLDGQAVSKAETAEKYGVSAKTVQRDLEGIRAFLDKGFAEGGEENSLVYDYQAKGYRLEQVYKSKLGNDEILAVCKILLDSRAFTKKTMEGVLEKLITGCVPPENRKMVRQLIRNELFHYVPPRHGSEFLSMMWALGDAIRHA
ncbi:MAG: WYL domain-containing protein, partial [Lachnospiraceae bacterium]|nr:WYL domain-containing protein [Lachnospiraceae bacterium]